VVSSCEHRNERHRVSVLAECVISLSRRSVHHGISLVSQPVSLLRALINLCVHACACVCICEREISCHFLWCIRSTDGFLISAQHTGLLG
jgi:hypothetical protein